MKLKNNGNKPVTIGKLTILPDEVGELPDKFQKNGVIALLQKRGELVEISGEDSVSSTNKKTKAKKTGKSKADDSKPVETEDGGENSAPNGDDEDNKNDDTSGLPEV